MERRVLLAIALMVLVAVVPSLFMRPAPRRAGITGAAGRAPAAQPAERVAPARAAAPADRPARTAPSPGAASVTDTASIVTAHSRYRFSTVGGAMDWAEMTRYRTFAAGDTGRARLVRPGDRILASRLVLGEDTVRLDSMAFAVQQRGERVELTGTADSLTVALHYAPAAGNDYLLDVTGTIGGLGGRGALLLVGLGSGFANTDADSQDNYRHYGVSVRRTNPEVVNFRSLNAGATRAVEGPFDWVALKSKYFIGVLLSSDSTRPQLGGALVTGGERAGRLATHASTWVTMPVGPDGRFRYQFYLGPQEYRALHPIGRLTDRASPYGWIFRPIVMPVATWITQFFIWMHENLRLGYGLVLVIFGVLVRLALWPLNQKAMKSQVAMMSVQPILKDIQERYKDDPTRLQQEMLKIYKEHKVNPFGGCLPMMLPLPILLALFFVFASTIELRGVPFLWLPDLSQRDPFFVVPVVMGASMWALSKLGQAGMPPNPQTKMMTTVMPLMMTVLFVNFASGLNLYYAVSNLVSLPQQWLINKARKTEMTRRQVPSAGKG
jgi:YidC/Oxa1 family membrane protein insertase